MATKKRISAGTLDAVRNNSIGNSINLGILLVLLVTLGIACLALKEYKRANRATVNQMLESSTSDLYIKLIELDKPHLYDLVYGHHYVEIEDPREKTKRMVEDLVGSTINDDWKNIPELYETLIRSRNISTKVKSKANDIDESYKRFMQGFVLFERVLFQTYLVHQMRREKIVDDLEWNDYAAYIKDFANHPVFLMTIYVNHCYGYIDNQFATALQLLLKDSSIAKILYKDVSEQDWPNALSTRDTHEASNKNKYCK